jgi:hypothetical protein
MATRKQKEVIALLSANVGISTAEAMREAGYSPSTARQPHRLTKSPVFAELARQYLGDDRLLEVTTAGLTADKVTRFKDGTEFKDPDYYARHQYLETALRIRNLIKPDDASIGGDINIQIINYKDSGKDKPST